MAGHETWRLRHARDDFREAQLSLVGLEPRRVRPIARRCERIRHKAWAAKATEFANAFSAHSLGRLQSRRSCLRIWEARMWRPGCRFSLVVGSVASPRRSLSSR